MPKPTSTKKLKEMDAAAAGFVSAHSSKAHAALGLTIPDEAVNAVRTEAVNDGVPEWVVDWLLPVIKHQLEQFDPRTAIDWVTSRFGL